MKYCIKKSELFLLLSLMIQISVNAADLTDESFSDSDQEEASTHHLFSTKEYEHYMQLINEIDPEAYQRLRVCENNLGEPCIRKAVYIEPSIFPGSDETQGHPTMYLESINDLHEDDQKYYLKFFIDLYNECKDVPALEQEERMQVLQLINSLDSALYKAIIKRDPEGIQHIQRLDDFLAANAASDKDGLPIILISSGTLKKYAEHKGLVRAMIAHELGHYVAGHFFEKKEPKHRDLFLSADLNKEIAFNKEGKKVSGQLMPRTTFYGTYERIKEHEADRIAVLDFDIPPSDAIKAARVLQGVDKEQDIKDPHKMTFRTDHPLWADRIKHFKSLRPEVELKKLHNKGKTVFDWESLAQEYKTAFNQE